MPIWEYRCPNGHRDEVIDIARKFDVPSKVCAVCGQIAIKVVGATHWQWGERPKESNVSRAIGRVKKAEREGRL
jgi:hypothetical protein